MCGRWQRVKYGGWCLSIALSGSIAFGSMEAGDSVCPAGQYACGSMEAGASVCPIGQYACGSMLVDR